MADPIPDIREFILRQCAAAAPSPWFPSVFARESTIPRDHLDRYVDELRLGGVIRIADWVQGKGQGYALTPEGASLLENTRDLARLRSGKLELRQEVKPVPADATSWQGTSLDRGNRVREAVLSPPPPIVTRVLILVNVLVFAYGMSMAIYDKVPLDDFLFGSTRGDVSRIDKAIGAMDGTMIAQGQWFRLLSCCFVHFGLLHLAVNMYSLYVVGSIQEGMWGRLRYLGLYLISGVSGSCAALLNNPATTLAGASGAIFGLMGSLAVWIFLNRRYLGPVASAWLRRLMIVFVINIFISSLPGISASAHFGGLAAGVIGGALLNVHRFGQGAVRVLALAAFVALPFLGIGAVVAAQSRDQRWQLIRLTLQMKAWEEVRAPAVKLWHEAKQLERSEVEPLLKHHLAAPDKNTERKALAALGAEYQKLAEGFEVLKEVGRADNSEEAVSYFERFKERLLLLEEVKEAVKKVLELSTKHDEMPLTWKQQDEEELERQKKIVASLEEARDQRD